MVSGITAAVSGVFRIKKFTNDDQRALEAVALAVAASA